MRINLRSSNKVEKTKGLGGKEDRKLRYFVAVKLMLVVIFNKFTEALLFKTIKTFTH